MKDTEFSSNNLFYFSLLGVVVLAIVLFLIFGRGNDNTSEVTETEQSSSEGAPVDSGEVQTPNSDSEDVDSDSTEISEPSVSGEDLTRSEDSTDSLPEDWDQLTGLEKVALNPFNCPADNENIIRLSAETGQCLEIVDDENVEVEDEGEDNARMIGQPFVLQFEDGLVLEVTTDTRCTPVEEIYQRTDSFGQDRVSSAFFSYLLKSNLLTPPGLADQEELNLSDDLTREDFLAHANLYPTNFCSLSRQYKNVGEDYISSSSCDFSSLHSLSSITLIDNNGNQHESYYVFPSADVNCAPGPWVFPAGHTARSYPDYWFLSDDFSVSQFVFSGEPEDFVVIVQ